MIVDDTSTDVDALREDLKFELIVLRTEVKKINKGWDFTAIVNPLLADQGPALLVILRIKNQIERLKKLKHGFEEKARDLQRPAAALAEAAQSFHVAEFPNTKESKPVNKSRPHRRRQPLPDIDIDEVLPSWARRGANARGTLVLLNLATRPVLFPGRTPGKRIFSKSFEARGQNHF